MIKLINWNLPHSYIRRRIKRSSNVTPEENLLIRELLDGLVECLDKHDKFPDKFPKYVALMHTCDIFVEGTWHRMELLR